MTSANGDLFYASEKISLALRIIATSHGTIQQRLLDGWLREGNHALPMGPGQAGRPMSQDLVDQLVSFNARMSCRPSVADEGAFSATILALSDEEAVAAAKELFDIEYQIDAELHDSR